MVSGDPILMVDSNMIIIAHLFFLLPCEYLASKLYINPFHLKDNAFSCGRIVFATTATESNLQAANFIMLIFTTKKNGARKTIGHKVSRDPLFPPKTALLRWVLHLRAHRAPPSTPIARVMNPEGRWRKITPNMISKTLKTTVGFCRPNLGFEAKDVYSCYLHAAGDMALLYSGVDSNITNLIGRWRSNNILKYLHVQAEPLMINFLWLMLTHGNYSFLKHQ